MFLPFAQKHHIYKISFFIQKESSNLKLLGMEKDSQKEM